mmetsp:Transcript_29330/g.47849  ORF Transcript_29330/g.47849 Transcript_29330/m.47849 type:complete len:243 (-) Transcript_29330:331-1059(-)
MSNSPGIATPPVVFKGLRDSSLGERLGNREEITSITCFAIVGAITGFFMVVCLWKCVKKRVQPPETASERRASRSERRRLMEERSARSDRSTGSIRSISSDFGRRGSTGSEMSASNEEELLESFKRALTKGVSVKMVKESGKEKMTLWLPNDNTLALCPASNKARDNPDLIHLKDVMFIQTGKDSPDSDKSENSNDPLLSFSVVTVDRTLDFQCRTQVKTEAMVQGLALLVTAVRNSAATKV